MDLELLKRVQAVLSVPEEPPCKTVLSVEKLQQTWARGNDDGEARTEFSDNYKLSIVKGQRRWQSFCEYMSLPDWRSALKGISFEDKGLINSFIEYILTKDGNKIKRSSTVDQYMRQLYAIYRKYTGRRIDQRFYTHVKATIAKYTHLQTEQSEKHFIGPDAFLYLAHFRWVRDNKTVFQIGLDRLDDATIRQLQMFTGARTHEFVLADTADPSNLIDDYYDKDDYYGDDTHADFSSQQPRLCSLCKRPDNRTTAATKVLCWEDIEFWILKDPYENGGRDRLALTIMHRFHKGHKRHSKPTRFIFVEEDLPVICPVSHILAKAIAEGVIKNEKFQHAEQFFQTRLTSRGLKVNWKDEFLHLPVFRRTVKCMEGFTKSNGPLTRYQYDKATKNLGWAAGLSDDLCSYDMRRGLMSALNETCNAAIRRQVSRHDSDKTFDNYYINTKVNVVTQDAFLGRTSKSPYLAIFNQMGMQIDENAPTKVTDEMMQVVPPSAEVGELERQIMALHDDNEACRLLRRNLKAAKQRHRRKIEDIFRKEYFKKNNDEELERQLLGDHRPREPLRRVEFGLPERRRIAGILGDLNDQLPEESLVQRKIDAINAWVDYAWKLEIKEEQPAAAAIPSSTPEVASHTDVNGGSTAPVSPAPKTAPTPTVRTNATFIRARHTNLIRDTMDGPRDPTLQLGVAGSSQVPGPIVFNPTPKRKADKRKQPPPCIFCHRTFTRNRSIWNHVDDHLFRCPGEKLPCPFTECKLRGEAFGDRVAFKAHIYHKHHVALRPDSVRTVYTYGSLEAIKAE